MLTFKALLSPEIARAGREIRNAKR